MLVLIKYLESLIFRIILTLIITYFSTTKFLYVKNYIRVENLRFIFFIILLNSFNLKNSFKKQHKNVRAFGK